MLHSCANAASTKYTVILAGPLFPLLRGPACRLSPYQLTEEQYDIIQNIHQPTVQMSMEQTHILQYVSI